MGWIVVMVFMDDRLDIIMHSKNYMPSGPGMTRHMWWNQLVEWFVGNSPKSEQFTKLKSLGFARKAVQDLPQKNRREFPSGSVIKSLNERIINQARRRKATKASPPRETNRTLAGSGTTPRVTLPNEV